MYVEEMCLSNMYWEDPVYVATYIINISLTKMVKYSSSYEAWFYKKPSVSHLKKFGSACFVHSCTIKTKVRFFEMYFHWILGRKVRLTSVMVHLLISSILVQM